MPLPPSLVPIRCKQELMKPCFVMQAAEISVREWEAQRLRQAMVERLVGRAVAKVLRRHERQNADPMQAA